MVMDVPDANVVVDDAGWLAEADAAGADVACWADAAADVVSCCPNVAAAIVDPGWLQTLPAVVGSC